MATTGQWELVVRGNKKSKNATLSNGKLSKEEKKQFMEKAPKVNVVGGIEKSSSGKENRKPKSPKSPKVNNEQKKKKTEKKTPSRPHPPGTLEEAVRRLSVAEMQNLLDVVVSRFVDAPLIWLKDLASYLNVRINPTNQSDPAFRGSSPSFPTSLLSPKVKVLLVNTLGKCNDSVLASFHKHCITSMVQEQIKGLSVAGYKVFIQILSLHYPHVGIVNLPSYCELRQSIQNQTPTCLSLLWAVGQCGIGDFTIGLKVWMELMVPLIGLKNYSSYVVEYGSRVFGGGGGDGAEDCGDVLGVREFFSILDFTWCSSGSLAKPVQRQLFALYPKVKTAAFSSTPEAILRNFFPSFLRRLNPDVTGALRVELLTCLVQCLTQDPHCWNIWAQLYVKHLPQSAILLQHLGAEWGVLSQSLRVQRKEVRDTIEGFAKTNKQMFIKARAVAGVIEASEATKELLTQMKTVKKKSSLPLSLPWTRLRNMIGVLIMAALFWDIKSAGSLQDSKVGQTAERLGLVPYIEVIWKNVKFYFIQSCRWCIANVPVYYSRGCELAGPYLLLVWAKLQGSIAYCWEGLESAAEYIPVLKEKLETTMPGFSTSVSHYASVAVEGLNATASTVISVATPYVLEAHKYMTTQILIGPLSPDKLQEYVVSGLHSLTQILSRLQSIFRNAIEDDPYDISNKTS